ncbi:hypothetical protein A5785_16195 [Gordonia sp. 852002-50395_SCH5434458]|nr:hypothetical protein A5785_16195 [Gordonia sp. 852002-50395_SCH5434458]
MSPPRLLDYVRAPSTLRRFDTTTIRHYDDSTLRRFDTTTIRHYDDSAWGDLTMDEPARGESNGVDQAA